MPAEERLEAVRAAVPAVVVAGGDEVIEQLVVALERDLDVARDLLLDADVVLRRAVRLQPLLPEHRVGLLRLRRLEEDAEPPLQRRAREAGRQVLPDDEARREVPRRRVAGVVEAEPGNEPSPAPRRELGSA